MLLINKLDRNLHLYIVIGFFCCVYEVTFFMLLRNKFNIYLLNTLLIISSIFISYNLNYYLNFQKFNYYKKRAFKFFFVCFLGLFFSNILLYFLSIFCDTKIAKIISIPPIAFFQFYFNKTWTFSNEIK